MRTRVVQNGTGQLIYVGVFGQRMSGRQRVPGWGRERLSDLGPSGGLPDGILVLPPGASRNIQYQTSLRDTDTFLVWSIDRDELLAPGPSDDLFDAQRLAVPWFGDLSIRSVITDRAFPRPSLVRALAARGFLAPPPPARAAPRAPLALPAVQGRLASLAPFGATDITFRLPAPGPGAVWSCRLVPLPPDGWSYECRPAPAGPLSAGGASRPSPRMPALPRAPGRRPCARLSIRDRI